MASNKHSLFTPLRLELESGITITGIHYLPDISPTSPTYRPLMVLIHGGTCTAHNFDVSPSLTASTAAASLSIPVISINRPGYLDSTPLVVPDGSTYHKELGRFEHEELFPALWRKYGVSNRCTALLPLGHSLGSLGIIISAGLHAKDPNPKYPLAGIIFSGSGSRSAANAPPPPQDPSQKLAWKRLIMCDKAELNLVPTEALDAIALQDHPIKPEELAEVFAGVWNGYWRTYSNEITVPVMFGQGEHDALVEGTLEHVKEVETCFSKTERFDGSLVRNAPHAIEWSHCAAGWYARCFGFALEVTASYALKGARIPSGAKES